MMVGCAARTPKPTPEERVVSESEVPYGPPLPADWLPPALAYYRVSVIQDGEPWPFTCQVSPYDTTFVGQFWTADSIVVGVEACNVEGGSKGIVWTDSAHIVKPDTIEVQLYATTGTDYNWVSIPLRSPLSMGTAKTVMEHVKSNTSPPADCLTVSYWNAIAQTMQIYTKTPVESGNFELRPAQPLRIEVDSTSTWRIPVENGGLSKWRWTRQPK
jgi:hypothetical protein